MLKCIVRNFCPYSLRSREKATEKKAAPLYKFFISGSFALSRALGSQYRPCVGSTRGVTLDEIGLPAVQVDLGFSRNVTPELARDYWMFIRQHQFLDRLDEVRALADAALQRRGARAFVSRWIETIENVCRNRRMLSSFLSGNAGKQRRAWSRERGNRVMR